MNKLAVALAGLALVGGAFAGGYLLHRWQVDQQSSGHESSRTAGLPQKRELKPLPEWTEWQYPGSSEQGSSKGGGGLAEGVTVGPTYSVALTTPDDLDKVLTWYSKKFNEGIIAVPTGSGSLSRIDSNNKDDPIINGNVLLASNRPFGDREKGTWRPVRMKVISLRTPRYDLVINVSRADGESHTHVVISYFPNAAGE